MFKKILSIVIILAMSLTCAYALVGCDDEFEKIDPNRTQLYVAVKDDGIGRAWADALDNAYEAYNPNVQVILSVKNEEYTPQNVKNTISFDGIDVYFLSSAGSLAGWVNSDLTSDYLLNITDVITDSTSGDSLEKRLNDASKPYYNFGTQSEPAYFGLPYWYASKGLVYDKDLFDRYDLYSLPGYIGIDGINGTPDDAYGPDGTQGTPDDGLPPTWTDFKLLLNSMVAYGITPFTWTGQHDGYFTGWLNSIWASYEGANDFAINNTFEGTDSQFGQINKNNAYQIIGQTGRYAALKVCEYIVNNPEYYTQSSFKTANSHTSAQLEYIMSSVDGNTPIAFLVEGGWWENEAKGSFAEMEAEYGAEYGYGQRNFGLMPAFKFVSGTAGKVDEDGIPDQDPDTLNQFVVNPSVGTDCSLAFVNKHTQVPDIAKDFMKFAFSNDMNAQFTSITGVMRNFKYEMSPAQIANMTKYASDVYYYCTADTSVFSTTSRNPIMANNYSFFADGWGSFITWHNDTRYTVPQKAFYNRSLNAEEYFAGMAYYYTKDKWEGSLASYLD